MKHKLTALALALAVAVGAAPAFAQEGDGEQAPNTARIELPSFDVPCRNAILVCADTGDVLYEKAADEAVPIASITKVMTLLLALEAVQNGAITMQDIVPISEHAYGMGGSQIWLEPGEQFTLDELVKAICVCSANDAAVAVAEYVGGSEPAFADMMNRRAAELGMTSTHFVNACGLDEEGHVSSARDVAKMSAALLAHPIILEYSQIWTDSLRGGATQMVNTNKLLKTYPGITGLKTGTTSKAGVCITATAERDGMHLIAVVLGAATGEERFEAAAQLLDYGFATYEEAEFPPSPQQFETLPVEGGAQREVELSFETPPYVLVRKGESANLSARCELPDSVAAPVEEGQPLGAVTLLCGEQELASYPVTAAQSVGRMTFSAAWRQICAALFAV